MIMTLDTSTTESIQERQHLFDVHSFCGELHHKIDVPNMTVSMRESIEDSFTLASDTHKKRTDFFKCPSSKPTKLLVLVFSTPSIYIVLIETRTFVRLCEYERFWDSVLTQSSNHSQTLKFLIEHLTSSVNRPFTDCLSDYISEYLSDFNPICFYRRENEMNRNLVGFETPTGKEELVHDIKQNAYSLSKMIPNTKKGSFGIKVAQIRICLGYTQEILAELLHTTRQSIVALEKSNSVNDLSDQMLFRVYYFANEVSENQYLPCQILNISKEVLNTTKECIEIKANN